MPTTFSNLTPDAGATLNAGAPPHYVDWGAIAAGSFVAGAISTTFLAFGSALGLSMASFSSGPASAASTSVTGLIIAAALWALWVQISSFIGGGYVAGRMRRKIGDATAHEVEMRDGSHGLIVWAVAVVTGALIAGFLTLSGITGLANSSAPTAAMDYAVDRLLRSETATAATAGSADTQQIGRALTKTVASGGLDASDKSYLLREISTRTGLSEADAQKRIDDSVAQLKAQANTARKYGILLAFLTTASLLIGAVAAWWAATAGGRHRNDGVDHSRLTTWR